MQSIGAYLLNGRTRTNLIVLCLMFLPWPLCISAAIIVSLVTFQNIARGLTLLIWAVLPVVIAVWQSLSDLAWSYTMAFLTCACALLITYALIKISKHPRLMARWRTPVAGQAWACVLELITLIGLLLFFIVLYWPGSFVANFNSKISALILTHVQGVDAVGLNGLQSFAHRVTPALLESVYLFFSAISLLSVMWATSWMMKLKMDCVRHPAIDRLRHIQMSPIFALCTVLACIGMWCAHTPGWEIILQLFAFPFFISGFSLFSWLYGKYNMFPYIQFMVWILIFLCFLFFTVWVFMILSVLGFLDSWIHTRRWIFLKEEQ